jgi:maleate isomerase
MKSLDTARNAVLRATLDALLQELLTATGASRTTIRLDWPNYDMQVDDVIAEALAPGVASLRGQTSINQRAAGTIQWLDRERRLLVQERLDDAEPAPPEALVRIYGAKAQMLAPLIRDNVLQGWVSVHYNPGPRRWSADDERAFEDVVRKVHAALDAA